MTIQITFDYAGQRKVVRIIDTNVLFIDLDTNMMSPFEGLQIRDRESIIREFPDLSNIQDKGELKTAVAKKFKDKMKELQSETERANWLINEFKLLGGIPLFMQRMGHRPIKIK